MSLNNLVGRTLEKITPDRTSIIRILTAAERNIADSKIKQISAENRFDAAYKAICNWLMQHYKQVVTVH